MTYPTTPNYSLPLVPNGDTQWGQAMRDALSTVDTAIHGVQTAVTGAQTTGDNAALAASLAAAAAASASTAANTANTAIANIASDNILSPGEKPAVVLDYTAITNEQAGIDAQADAYVVSRTAYDSAVSALTSYLGTLTGWNVIPGSDVVIVGTTFRQKFADVYSTRQALLNAIYAKAKALADAAQTGVNTINDPDTLTTGEKPQIILDYNAITGENADLVAKANAYSVSHATYDAAYTALVTTYLPTLTSPTAWNSLSGTTSLGTGNRVALWNPKWTAVKNAAADLRNAIAVGTAQDAISQAATDASTKANAAQLASQPHQVAWAYASKPALPNALYPAGYYAITTDARMVQVNPAGTAWTDVLVAATGLFGQLFSSQLVVSNFSNLIPNPNSEASNPPAGSVEAAGVIGGSAHSGTKCRQVVGIGAGYSYLKITPTMPVEPGEKYYIEWWAEAGSTLGSSGSNTGICAWFEGVDAYDTAAGYGLPQIIVNSYSYQKFSQVITVPSGATTMDIRLVAWNYTNGYIHFYDDFVLRKMADASLIVDGTLQALVARVPLLYSLDMRSGSDASGYTAGTASAAPIGFRISANQFTTTYIGGATDSTCQMELGGSANFGGYKVQTVNNRAMTAFNRIRNGTFYGDLTDWSTLSSLPMTYDATTRTPGAWSGSAALTSNGAGLTQQSKISQSVNMPPSTGTINLSISTYVVNTSATIYWVKAYLYNVTTNTETLVATWTPSSFSTWQDWSVDVTSILSGGGDFVMFLWAGLRSTTAGDKLLIDNVKIVL